MTIVDTHVHIGRDHYEPVEMLLAQMELNGVDKTVLVQSTATLDNSYVLECRQRFPGRLAVVCRVDVDDPAAPDTLESLRDAGAETLRIRNFHRSPGNDPLAIWRAAARLGVSVSVGGPAEGFASAEFAALVEELPNLTVIIEHLAGMGIHAIGAPTMPPDDVFRQALTLAQFPNTVIKIHGMGEICDPPFPYQAIPPFVRMAYEAFGPDRVIWGSDWPRVTNREGYRNSLRHTLDQMESWCPTGDLNKIFAGNALRIWKFD
jgi:L-fuconolactonase